MKSTAIAFLLAGSSTLGASSGQSLVGKWKRHWKERAALRRLHALDDHMLVDMGLSRGAINISVVREGLRD